MRTVKESEVQQTDLNVGNWLKKREPNCIPSWEKYEGPDVPTTPDQVETLKTALLKTLWSLKQTVQTLPRHQRYTLEQFNAGFPAERQRFWIPLMQQLIDFLHQWRAIYPGIDITRRLGYEDLVELKDELSRGERLLPVSFNRKLTTVTHGFHTSFDYCTIIDDKVILEKFQKLDEALNAAADLYRADIDAMEAFEAAPRQLFPGT